MRRSLDCPPPRGLFSDDDRLHMESKSPWRGVAIAAVAVTTAVGTQKAEKAIYESVVEGGAAVRAGAS